MRKPADWPAELTVSFLLHSRDGGPAIYLVREGAQEVARVSAAHRGRWYWRGWIGSRLQIEEDHWASTLRDALADIASAWTAAADARQTPSRDAIRIPAPAAKESVGTRIRTLAAGELVARRLYLCVSSDDRSEIGEIVLHEGEDWILSFGDGTGTFVYDREDMGTTNPRYVPLREGAVVVLRQTGADVSITRGGKAAGET
jgi:hypothetical protein